MARIPSELPRLPATDGGPRPGDFQIGSEKSRAAAKLLAHRKKGEAPKLIVNPSIPRPAAHSWAQETQAHGEY
jgi:hypothetical protein